MYTENSIKEYSNGFRFVQSILFYSLEEVSREGPEVRRRRQELRDGAQHLTVARCVTFYDREYSGHIRGSAGGGERKWPVEKLGHVGGRIELGVVHVISLRDPVAQCHVAEGLGNHL